MKSIILKEISHTYENEYVQEKVLDGINLELEEGKMYCLVGPSGSGKTTLLNIMGGLLNPTSGSVIIGSKDITKYTQKQLADLRVSKIGYIFQNYNLIPFLNVRDNILLQLRIAKRNINDSLQKYEELLKRLELKDKEYAYVNQLSGGQQQRVALARAIVNNPEMLIADEPTGNLDPNTAWDIMELINDINLIRKKFP